MRYANVYADGRINNSLFAVNDDIHKFNPTYTPRLLRHTFLKHGIELNTPDLNIGRDIAFDFYIEGSPCVKTSVPKFLLALENPHINKFNENIIYCKQFSKVFSWDIRLHHLSNVVPIMIPHPMVKQSFFPFSERHIFSCLINANKTFKKSLPSDLYLERIKTIKWYENNAIDKFELYGMGWNKSTSAYNFLGRIARILPQIKLKLFNKKIYPSFRGELSSKSEVLNFSKFSYCYENTNDLNNYITEKIFDALVCGCIPVYWGADNVAQFIPVNCYIDRRNFIDTAAVHHYLISITEDQYKNYQENILLFLNSNKAEKFQSKNIISTIVENVIKNV